MPTVVGVGAAASGISSAVVPRPTGLLTDDILLMVCASPTTVAVTVSNAAGGTWAQAPDSPQDVAAGDRLTVFWSRYNGTQTDPTIAGSDHVIGEMIAIRGCPAAGDPWDVTSGGSDATSDTSVSVPGATTTVANCLVVVFCAHTRDSAVAQFSAHANADLANLTERMDASTSTGGGGGFGCWTGEKAAAGAYGATTATLLAASPTAFATYAMKPA
jgi:hypothetical protein